MSDGARERRITARLVRQGDDEQAFDREFWAAIPPERRVEMLWEMVLEARRIQGLEGDEPRLQRSVVRLFRR